MEFSLHRQLKSIYQGCGESEVRLDNFRIDAVRDGLMIEVQFGSLAAIRKKVARLVEQHRVLVVKPLVVNKLLVKLDRQGGREIDRRNSPKHESAIDIVHDLVYWTRLFPHPNLAIETPMVRVVETRFPGSGRRRRRRGSGFQRVDIELVEIVETHRFAAAIDLLNLIPRRLKWPTDTAQLAKAMAVPRWVAQRLAYCLKHCGAITPVSKSGNAHVYELVSPKRSIAARKRGVARSA